MGDEKQTKTKLSNWNDFRESLAESEDKLYSPFQAVRLIGLNGAAQT